MDHRRSTRFELLPPGENRRAYRQERKTEWSLLPCRVWQSRATDLAGESAAATSARRCKRATYRQEKARCVQTRMSLSQSSPMNPPPTRSARPTSTMQHALQDASNPRLRRQKSKLRAGSQHTAAPCRDGYPLCLLPFLWQRGAQSNDWVAPRQNAPWTPIDR